MLTFIRLGDYIDSTLLFHVIFSRSLIPSLGGLEQHLSRILAELYSKSIDTIHLISRDMS